MVTDKSESNAIEDFIIETIKVQKPKTTGQLVELVQQKYALSEKEIVSLILKIEEQNKVHFEDNANVKPTSVRQYFFSTKSAWYWLTIILAIVTAISVFTIPENFYPVAYVRQALGIPYVLFLPGFAFINLLYPLKDSRTNSSHNMIPIERAVLSLGISIALTVVALLSLNYTPWGIQITPVTLSLLVLTVLFATAAVLREYQTNSKTKNINLLEPK